MDQNIKLTGEQTASGQANDRNIITTTKDFDVERTPVEPCNTDDALQDAPIEFLCNWYDLFDVALDDTTPASTTQYDPWLAIWNNISNLLQARWRYFRCDMELMITIDSGPFDFGSFLIGWHPEVLSAAFDKINADPWLFDLSTGGTHSLMIPYSNLTKCYDVRRGQNQVGFWNCVPKIYLTNLAMGTMAKTFSSSVHFKGRFTNMHCWGVTYLPNDVAFTTDFEIQSQMDDQPIVHANPAVKIAGAALSLGATLGTATTTVGAINYGISKYKDFYKAVKEAWGNVAAFYDEADNVFAGSTVVPTDSTDEKEVKSSPPQLQNVPSFFGGMSDIAYSPKENLSVTMKRVIPHGLADRQMFHNIRTMAQIPCLMRIGHMIKDSIIYEGVAPFPCIYKDYATGNANDYSPERYVDYLSQFSQLFRYWRGGIKYSLTFHTTPMTTARVLIQVMNNGAEFFPSGLLSANMGAFVFKKQIEVTGFYRYDFVVPFIFNFDWAPVGMSAFSTDDVPHEPIVPSYFSVRCNSITSGLEGSATNPQVTYNLIRSGAEDIQFRNLAGVFRERGYEIIPPVESQMKVRSSESKYENICRGNSNLFMIRPVDEDVMTVETLLHRWSYRLSDESDFTASRPYKAFEAYADANIVQLGLFDYLLNQFRYVRGNVQYRLPVEAAYTNRYLQMVMHPAISSVAIANVGQDSDTAAGAAIAVPGLSPILETEVPIESYSDWVITYPSRYTENQNPQELFAMINDPYSPVDYYVRAGRGFQIAFLNPPLATWNKILYTMGTSVS